MVGQPRNTVPRKEPYAEQREAEAVESLSLVHTANHLEDLAKTLNSMPIDGHQFRPIAIAITHLQEAAMWLNRAHYKKD